MKRIIKLLLITLLSFPFIAKADMGAPQLIQFDIIVTREGGIDYYEWNVDSRQYAVAGHIDKDTVLTVRFEDEESGFYDVDTKDGKSLRIKREGVTPKIEEVDPTSKWANKAFKSYVAKVYKNEGVDVYKGPSIIYDKVGHLDKDVSFTVNYVNELDGSWVYADVKGVKGWVNSYNNALLSEQKMYYIFTVETKLGNETIPKNEILYSEWSTDQWGKSSLFSYKGEEGLINTFKSDTILSVSDKVKLYKTKKLIKTYSESPYDPSIKMSGKIDANKEFYYIGEGDNIDGAYIMMKDTHEYCWIVFDEDVLTEVEEVPLSSIINKPTEETTTTTTAVTSETPSENNNKLSNKEIIIISVSAGVVLTLTAIVIILLINKKKKNKPLETLETVQPVSSEQPSYVNDEINNDINNNQ